MENSGEILAQKRKELNLSVEQVSEKTKIRRYVINALEKGAAEDLPPIYAKSFLKTYINFLGIEEAEVTELMDAISAKEKRRVISHTLTGDKSIPEITKTKSAYKGTLRKNILSKYAQANLINYLLYIALITAAISLLYFALFTTDDNEELLHPDDLALNADTAVVEEDDEGLLSWFQTPDSLILEAKAIDSSWIRIDTDGKFNEQVLLIPGMTKRWSAKEFFVLTVGNVGAIQFIRNGTLLQPFGPKGHVIRNIKITADKVESSSNPWQNDSTERHKPKKKKKRKIPRILDSPPIEDSEINN